MKSRKNWKRFLSVLLTVSIVITTVAPGTAVSAAENSSAEVNISTQDDDTILNTQTEKTDDAQDTSEASVEEPQSQQADNDTTEDASTKAATDTNLYQDGSICIYNEQQLKAVGTGTQVHEGDSSADTFGIGAVLTDEDGNELTYAVDGSYTLMNDIPLTKGSIWTLPEGFGGSFNGAEITTERPLYDAESNTIYVYNNYQLITINDPDAIKIVMSNDMIASEFGVGQVVYTDEEKATQLEYTKDHNYILSKDFTEEMPEMKAIQVLAEVTDGQLDGRSYIGQVIFNETEGEKTKQYILIGNKQQLEAIGRTDSNGNPIKVTEPVWAQDQEFRGVINIGKWTDVGSPYLYYNGDADLKTGELLYDDPDADNPGVGKNTVDIAVVLGQTRQQHFGSKKVVSEDGNTYTYDKNAKEHVNMERLSGDDSDPAYTTGANYIIFRDIDLGNKNWTPLMFSGTMEGRKNMQSNQCITISNIAIELKEDYQLDTSEYLGIGFFATITNEINVADVGISSGTVSVSNLNLSNVTVKNNTSQIKSTETVVNFITSSLGWLVGGLVDLLTGVLTFGKVSLNLKDILTGVLDARKADPSSLATGSFAGRIVGDVIVKNCSVENASVTSVNAMTGGFVGYSEGMTEYDGLSKLLGITEGTLSSLLNVIPGLGLGDLITILLKNSLDVGSLIPTKYINPSIEGCSIGLTNNATIGSSTKDYSGGFVGLQIGTSIRSSKVTGDSIQILAEDMAGGFSGATFNAEIEGLLSDLGIDLMNALLINSFILDSQVEASSLTITAASNYAGGITGALADSYVVDSKVDAITDVESNNYAGGVTGRMTLARSIALAEYSDKNTSLTQSLGDLLSNVLSGEEENSLLALTGVNPSIITGVNIEKELEVEAKGEYAGGFVGQSDGCKIISSENLIENSYLWQKSTRINYTPKNIESSITNLKSVTAKNNAGGVAGNLTTASAAGILDTTLGIGNYLPFQIEDITVTGIDSGYSVTATENYAGGGFGYAIGGTIKNATLSKLGTVTANNYAGGFIGVGGTGDLASASGLNVLGLDLISITNLLSIAQGVVLTIDESSVAGIQDGLSVLATGTREGENSTEKFLASGFIASANSVDISNSHVTNLRSVIANETVGYAGGFIGISQTGGLADVVGEQEDLNALGIDGLLGAVPYLIPSYTDCTVAYVSNGENAQTKAAVAGGFVAELQSGTIDNTSEKNHTAVYQLENVNGIYYAGGFAGRSLPGGLVKAGGLSLLGSLVDLNITSLISLLNYYVPIIKNAGVSSVDQGFIVSATSEDQNSMLDAVDNSGSAGGFIGYGSGVQISSCNVNKLKHTAVEAPKDLEAADGSSYFDDSKSSYAITAARYAGGFIGKMDIGSTAAIGSGLSLLQNIQLTDVLSALSVVTSTIEYSHVFGAAGGYAVLANNNATELRGHAGGYAGSINGGHIQNSHANNFSYIIGQQTAGGYVGNMEPGNVASVLGETTVLGGLVSLPNDLLNVAETFVPTIRNSYTTCVPCGGVVRANESSSGLLQKGMAGGYVGHSAGGQIWGNNADDWKNIAYTGEQTECAVKRIRSVYGAEYAGGFSGYMECASTASSGSLSLLYGLVKTENLLGLLDAIYPTDENTAVYGPLLELDMTTWNSWVNAVGDAGTYADELKDKGAVTSDDDLKKLINKYAYGYCVVAGREQTDTISASDGNAGGYTGSMVGGVITNATATGVKEVHAIQGAAGGFAGKMLAGGVTSIGEASIAGLLSLDGNLLGALQTFVPVIEESSVEGYQSGAVITATGQSDTDASVGCAGGYVGHMLGGQIKGKLSSESTDSAPGCNITKLRSVEASVAAGGYAGRIDSGAAADVNTNALGGVIGEIINKVIGTSGSIASVLKTIVSTVHYAKVEAVDSYGIIVQTVGDQAEAAGGFVGIVQGAVLGSEEEEEGLQAIGIRTVTGAEQAGGFLGIGDVAAVAEVSGGDNTTILGLIEAGAIDVLDAFRPYIYEAKVVGSQDGNGLTITATKERSEGSGDSLVYIGGNAGGFGGSFLNGTVTNSTVEDLKSVKAPNYTGGFIGYSGKSGVVDADKVDLGDGLLDLNAGILDVFGSHINYCNVIGLKEGYTIQSTGGNQEIAGGFIGYADLSRMEQDAASNVRQVYSDEIAGGFVGKTSMAYLVSVDVNSKLLDPILKVVNGLIKALYLDDLQNVNFVDLGIPEILEVEVLSNGKTLGVTLFGLHITVALSQDDAGETDVAIITIGDSEIKLPCTKDGVANENNAKEEIVKAGGLEINLIKANRTKIENSSVTGISVGYDVFGSGAYNDKNGESNKGYTGGFVGYNYAGLLEGNQMIMADTIRGYAGQIGEFSGYTDTNTSYDALEDPTNIEKANTYQVYRTTDQRLTVVKKNDTVISRVNTNIAGVCHTINHLDVVKTHNNWKDVYMTTSDGYVQVPIKVYVSDAQADLMYGVETYISTGDETAKPGEMQDPCDETVNITIQKVWKDSDDGLNKRPTSITVELYQDNNLYTGDTSHPDGQYQITGDTSNVWSITIQGLPAVYEQEDGTYKNYTYTVKEAESQEYITEYTKDTNGYNYVITNTHTSTLVKEDTVVIDFGLPVKVNVLTNDAIEATGTLTGVSKGVLDNIYKVTDSDVTEELDRDNKDDEGWTKGDFGRAKVEVEGQTITYEPTTMEMNSFDRFTYSVKTTTNTVNEANGSDCYIYSTLTVIPATTIYYEDNVSMITYKNADKTENPQLPSLPEEDSAIQKGVWYTVTNATGEFNPAEYQDTDRPGILKPGEKEIEDDMENMYGYDSNYTSKESSDTSRTKYSNGSSAFVRVEKGKNPTATFTFTGTGFDLISLTSTETGVIRVKVINQETKKTVNSWTIDTYYGYTAEKKTDGTIEWKEIESNKGSALYQVPVIRAKDLPYGTYNVTITPSYAQAFDHNKDEEGTKRGYYDFYLDAIRIYTPANADMEKNVVIKDAYVKDGEYNPTYKEIRGIVIANGDFEKPSTGVYIDGIPNATWSDYKEAGPSHELYLAENQTIAFNLTVDQIPTSVRIGAKSIQSSVEFSLGFSVNESITEEDNWVTYNVKSITCNTATDLYYDITDQCVWREVTDTNGKVSYVTAYPITVTNTSDSILSLTYLKWMSKDIQVTE